MKKVLVFGTFDGIHKGHLNFLKQAKKYGDYLIVVVARDKNVKRIKNRSPKKSEKKRLQEIRKVELVDKARLGYLRDPYKVIYEVKPDVICLGYDQNSFTDELDKEIEKMNLRTKVYRLKPYKANKYHSSIIHVRH